MRSYQHIILKEAKNHAELILNRPEKRNALNDIFIEEIKSALSLIENSRNIKTVSIKANGSAFCSGADLEHLKKMRNFSNTENLQDSMALGRLYLQIYTMTKPVIAVVDGPALAGGCGLATVCDFIIASEKAKFGYPEVKIGFFAAMVSVFLIRQVGERVAKQLLLSGHTINAKTAMRFGLINDVYMANQLEEAENLLLKSLHQNSGLAMEHSKKLFSGNIEQEIETLAQKNADFRETSDFIEGINSFLEKRTPKWNS